MATVNVEYYLNVECPHCSRVFDLVDQNDDGCFTTPIFNNRWDDLKGESVECPHCGRESLIVCVQH